MSPHETSSSRDPGQSQPRRGEGRGVPTPQSGEVGQHSMRFGKEFLLEPGLELKSLVDTKRSPTTRKWPETIPDSEALLDSGDTISSIRSEPGLPEGADSEGFMDIDLFFVSQSAENMTNGPAGLNPIDDAVDDTAMPQVDNESAKSTISTDESGSTYMEPLDEWLGDFEFRDAAETFDSDNSDEYEIPSDGHTENDLAIEEDDVEESIRPIITRSLNSTHKGGPMPFGKANTSDAMARSRTVMTSAQNLFIKLASDEISAGKNSASANCWRVIEEDILPIFIRHAEQSKGLDFVLDSMAVTGNVTIHLTDILTLPRRDLKQRLNEIPPRDELTPNLMDVLETVTEMFVHQQHETTKGCVLPSSWFAWWRSVPEHDFESVWTENPSKRGGFAIPATADFVLFHLLVLNARFVIVEAVPNTLPTKSLLKVYDCSQSKDENAESPVIKELRSFLPRLMNLVSQISSHPRFKRAIWTEDSIKHAVCEQQAVGGVDSGVLCLHMIECRLMGMQLRDSCNGLDDAENERQEMARHLRLNLTRAIARILRYTERGHPYIRALADSVWSTSGDTNKDQLALTPIPLAAMPPVLDNDSITPDVGPRKKRPTVTGQSKTSKKPRLVSRANFPAVDTPAVFDASTQQMVAAILSRDDLEPRYKEKFQAELKQILDHRDELHSECWHVVEKQILPLLLKEFVEHRTLSFIVDGVDGQSRELKLEDVITLPRREPSSNDDWYTTNNMDILGVICAEAGEVRNSEGELYHSTEDTIPIWGMASDGDLDDLWQDESMRPARGLPPTVRSMVFPFNPKAHWVLVEAEAREAPEKSRIFVYDCKRPLDPSKVGGEFNDAKDQVPGFMKAVGKDSPNSLFRQASWSRNAIEHRDCPRMETDNKDCGAFVLDALETRMAGHLPSLEPAYERGLLQHQLAARRVKKGMELRLIHAKRLAALLTLAVKLPSERRSLSELASWVVRSYEDEDEEMDEDNLGGGAPLPDDAAEEGEETSNEDWRYANSLSSPVGNSLANVVPGLKDPDQRRLGCDQTSSNDVSRSEYEQCREVARVRVRSSTSFETSNPDGGHRLTISRLSYRETVGKADENLALAEQHGKAFDAWMELQGMSSYSKRTALRLSNCRTRWFPTLSEATVKPHRRVWRDRGQVVRMTAFSATTLISSAIKAATLEGKRFDLHVIGRDGFAARRDLLYSFCASHDEFIYAVQHTPAKKTYEKGTVGLWQGWSEYKKCFWISWSSKDIVRHLDPAEDYHDQQLETYLSGLDALQEWKDLAAKNRAGNTGRMARGSLKSAEGEVDVPTSADEEVDVVTPADEEVDFACPMMRGNPKAFELVPPYHAICVHETFTFREHKKSRLHNLARHMAEYHNPYDSCPRCFRGLGTLRSRKRLQEHIACASCDVINDGTAFIMTLEQWEAFRTLYPLGRPTGDEEPSTEEKFMKLFRALFPNHQNVDDMDPTYNPFKDPESGYSPKNVCIRKIGCCLEDCSEFFHSHGPLLTHLEKSHGITLPDPTLRYRCGYTGCQKHYARLCDLYTHIREKHRPQ